MSNTPSIRPIFIVGSGRSGTTLLFRLLQGHPSLAWISRLTDRFPALPFLSAFSRIPALRQWRPFQPSTDAIRAYAHCGLTDDMLRRKGASLTAQDADPASTERLRRMVASHAQWMGRDRFVNKSTMNTMRVGLLLHAFPDARFVHIVRNGYAVTNSLVRVAWWPDTHLWWMDTTPRRWEENGGDPYELAARNWSRQVGEIMGAKSLVPAAQYFECRYERLITDTDSLLDELLRFCDLERNPAFDAHARAIAVRPGNEDKWRDQLDAAALETIARCAGDMLRALGYDLHA